MRNRRAFAFVAISAGRFPDMASANSHIETFADARQLPEHHTRRTANRGTRRNHGIAFAREHQR